MIEWQHLTVKFFLAEPEGLDLEPFIGVFNGWIQAQAFEGLLVDVADYRHVHHGPGLVLIGHEANVSLDQSAGRPGLLYHRKARVDGPPAGRVRQALAAALRAALKLERENGLRFDGAEVELAVNDRLHAPNTDATFESARPALEEALDGLYAGAAYRLARTSRDPRERFTVHATASAPFSLEALARNLEAAPGETPKVFEDLWGLGGEAAAERA
jgi:hypothetical protein